MHHIEEEQQTINSSQVKISSYSYSNMISLKSIQIIKPQLDTTLYKKLNISIIMNKLDDHERNLVRYISSKFAMALYDDWDTYSNQQKLSQKTLFKKSLNGQPHQELIIIGENSLAKILRAIKFNPTLRVILLVKNIQQFTLKEQHSFVMVTSCCKEIQQYLNQHKKRFILISKR